MKTTIGLDAEFLFVDNNNRIVSASKYVNSTSAKFGTDGCSTLAEIRPTYAVEPDKLVQNMLRTFKTTARNKPIITLYKWRAGSFVGSYPIGAHIHIGVKAEEGDVDYRLLQSLMDKRDQLVRVFDRYLAVPVMFLEVSAEANKRKRSYGQLSGSRAQAWGIEYRTLPSFIVSPAVTLGILCMAKTLADEVMFNDLQVVGFDQTSKMEFLASSKSRFWKVMDEVYVRYETFAGFKKYKDPIKKVFSLMRQGWTFKNIEDMKSEWGIEKAELNIPTPQFAETFWRALEAVR